MAQINSCLKSVFTAFNILFAIFGGLIIVLALVVQFLSGVHGEESQLQGHTAGLIYLYIIGAITMIIAILGAYGALKEKKWALIVFLVFMVLGFLLMTLAGAVSGISRPLVKKTLEKVLHNAVPLDNSPEQLKNEVDKAQKAFHCCGLFSYRDWNQLPDSCMCDQEDVQEGECQKVGSSYVYKQTCYPILTYYDLLVFDIVLGVFVSLAILALLGMILSSIMIHQMRYPDKAAALSKVPAAFVAQPLKYKDLRNLVTY